MHDPRLLDILSRYSPTPFDAEVYRATPAGLNPLTPSAAGGRWSPRGSVPVLYTSLARDGALAEISFHWSLLTPLPTKPVTVHRLRATASKTIRLLEVDLGQLGVARERLGDIPYKATQDIGAAVAFLGYEGLIVPSARWNVENYVIFAENSDEPASVLEVTESKEADWQEWARQNGFIP